MASDDEKHERHMSDNSMRQDAPSNGDATHIERHATSVHESTPVDAAMSKTLDRKFDTHILPWLFGFWLLAFIDRTNIGNAKIDGLVEDLNLGTGLKFNTALAIFYVPYILVDVPSNLVLKYFKAGYYLPFILTSWGLITTFQGFVTNYAGLLAVSLEGQMWIFNYLMQSRHDSSWVSAKAVC